MANLNLKFVKTKEMKDKGMSFHVEHFPERAKIYDELNRRRKFDKPIDGNCFKDAGEAIREMQKKGIR